MIIADSSIDLTSQRSFSRYHEKIETFDFWKTGRNPQQPPDIPPQQDISTFVNDITQPAVKVSISDEAVNRSDLFSIKELEEQEEIKDLNLRVLKDLVERVTGRRVKISPITHDYKPIPSHTTKQIENTDNRADQHSSAFGFIYELKETYYETEMTEFSANGKVITANGVELSFSTSMNMSREFYEENGVSIRLGEALKDPLVINLSSTHAQLSDVKYSFDIDGDSVKDSISFVESNSGFLSLDKNSDGEINNGTELFGAITGDGFRELETYDQDKNGWIDEKDHIFDQLRIWVKEEDSKNHLYSLDEKGVAAIYLGSVSTSFKLNDHENTAKGQIQSTGVYLRDDYSVGTVQKVDLAI